MLWLVSKFSNGHEKMEGISFLGSLFQNDRTIKAKVDKGLQQQCQWTPGGRGTQ